MMAGAGMLAALGVRFINGKGEVIDPSGGTLHSIVTIDFFTNGPTLKGGKDRSGM